MRNNILYNPEDFEETSVNMTISGYEIIDDKIVITYLDEHKEEIPINEFSRIRISEMMMDQAMERDKHKKELYSSARLQIIFDIFCMVTESLLASFFISKGIKEKNAVPFIFATGFIYLARTNIRVIQEVLEELDDIKKYEIFLSFCKSREFQAFRYYSQIYDGVKCDDLKLDINTIDNFSAKQVRKIRDNIRGLLK